MEGQDHQGHDPEHGSTVRITVNDDSTVSIHRGHRTVAEIKTVGGVALADDLEQVIEGRLTPLADDGAVVIKGGEIFISHPKDAGSS